MNKFKEYLKQKPFVYTRHYVCIAEYRMGHIDCGDYCPLYKFREGKPDCRNCIPDDKNKFIDSISDDLLMVMMKVKEEEDLRYGTD